MSGQADGKPKAHLVLRRCCGIDAEDELIANFGAGRRAKHVYLTATLDAAVWGAELAVGEGAVRIYVVEPTGQLEDDPNLSDKKFPGNPTKSYGSKESLRVIGEYWDWQGHAPDVLQAMKDNAARLAELGVRVDDD